MIPKQIRACRLGTIGSKEINCICVPPRKGSILSHVLTTAHRNDAAVAPELLSSLQGWDIEFALEDAAYDREQICKTAEQWDIFFVSLMNWRNSEERHDAYGRVIPVFLNTRFGKWLFGLRSTIERVFNQWKMNGLEQPRWHGLHRYLLHVQLCILIHHFEFLL